MKIALLSVTGLVMVVDWWSRWRDDERVEQWAKPLATIGVIGLALASGAATSHVAVAVAALVLCLAGDVFLMPVLDRFVAGLASFLLGHLVFIALFVMQGLDTPPLAGVALVLSALLVATVGLTIVRAAAHRDPGLRVPVLAYLLVISLMAVVGWATGSAWVTAGSTLFVVSDAVLGWQKFVRPFRHASVVVMVTYHAAIASLALSLW